MPEKVTQFTPVSSLDGTEMVPVIKNGLNQRTSVDALISKKIAASSFTLTADGPYEMAAGDIITAIVVDCSSSFTLNIGSTSGGNDLGANIAIPGGDWYGLSILIPAKTTRIIYFSGIIASTEFILIKNSI